MTGTFDNWTKSERLERVGQVFQKTVTLPESSEKIYYKVSALSSFRSVFVQEPRGAQVVGTPDRTSPTGTMQYPASPSAKGAPTWSGGELCEDGASSEANPTNIILQPVPVSAAKKPTDLEQSQEGFCWQCCQPAKSPQCVAFNVASKRIA